MKSKKTHKEKSFFTTVLFSFISMSLLTTIILTAFLTLNQLKSSIDMTTSHNHNLLSQTNYAIDQMNDNVKRLALTLFNDKDIISYLYGKEPDSLTAVLASRTLDKQLMTMSYVESVYLYNASMDTFFISKTGELLTSEAFTDEDIKDVIKNPEFIASYNGIPIPAKMNDATNTASVISYFLFDLTTDPSGNKNAIIINISPSFLTHSINSMNRLQEGSPLNFIVMDENGKVIGSVLSPELKEKPNLYASLNSSLDAVGQKLFLRFDNTNYLESVTRNNENNWYLISMIEAQVIFHDVILSALFGAVIMSVVLLLCFFICLHLSKRLNSPIKAIAHIMNSGKMGLETTHLQGTEEFRVILSSFQAIQEQNRQFDRLKQETAYSARQNYLNILITGNKLDSAEQAAQKLRSLNLPHLLDNSLCMVVFKIDHYRRFCSENNPKELWVLRFAIVNIMEEISGHYFTNNVLSRGNDRFIILIDCMQTESYQPNSEKIESMIREIQENVSRYMTLTLTAAYSNSFRGLEHLPSMANNMEESLQLRMIYGHGSIISPYLTDDTETGSHQFSSAKMEQLIALIGDEKCEQSQILCHQLTSHLFQYDCNEILSGTMQLLYSLYLELSKKYPKCKEENTFLLKECLSNVMDAETTPDIDTLVDGYIQSLCSTVTTMKNEPMQDNIAAITKRVCDIVEKEYSNPSLCLCYIAEEIGLTPNYLGKMFKLAMQKSISQYILEYRFTILADLLNHSTLPLNNLLDKVGIEKTNYFYTQFKKYFGVSLQEYRAQRGTNTPHP